MEISFWWTSCLTGSKIRNVLILLYFHISMRKILTIGLPGETVQVVDGYVYINGSRLESDIYGNERMDDPMAASQPITLGEDEYFVLGDNRNHSQDSRDPSVGEVKKDTIMGKAWGRIYPFDKMGVIRHE